MSRLRIIEKIKIEIATIICVVSMALLFAVCWRGYYSPQMAEPFFREGNWLMVILFYIIYRLTAELYDTFKISVSRITELVYCQFLSLAITDSVMYIIISLLCRQAQSLVPIIVTLFLQLLAAIVWAFIAKKWYFATHAPEDTVIIWDVRRGLDELISLYGLEKRFKVVKKMKVRQCLENLAECFEGVDTVFLSGVHSGDRNRIVKYCIEQDINIYVIPRVGDAVMSAARPFYLFHLPINKLVRYSPSLSFIVLKRIGDIVVSLLALVILSPVMLISGIMIKLTDGGSILYRQCRLTLNGKRFNILKFRSMRADAEKDGVARLSTGSMDDRITPVGRFIRSVRIDELPQLINILKGEMSVVGPRPERPEIFEEYTQEMPEFGLRLQAKAGLTGLAQVYGRYNTSPYDKLLMDLAYIANPSVINDLRICFLTVKILFLPESTKGIAVGATTAMEELIRDEEEQ